MKLFFKSLQIITLLGCLLLGTTVFSQQKIPALVPYPVELELKQGTFEIDENTLLTGGFLFKEELDYFSDMLLPSTGMKLKYAEKPSSETHTISVLLDDKLNKVHGKEAYQLDVSEENIVIKAGGKPGAFYGFQTLLQLLPTQVFSRVKISDAEWKIPMVHILDYPRFKWRGFMLDAARSFQPLSYVKKVVDQMALHKMNTFHWHLTDDHGWRIEIKKYPELTEVGAWRNQPNYPQLGDKGKYGGYYTQEELREIVDYAKQRHITIVPEVDLPGHSSAFVEVFPEMICDSVERQKEIQFFDDHPKRGVNYIRHPGSNVVCAGKERNYEIIRNMLGEVMDIFPSEFIHIGGDEVDKKWWKDCPECGDLMKREGLKDYDELQAYFIRRMEKIINARGRKLIGWDEILDGGLSNTATVMGWRSLDKSLEALEQGKNVVIAANQAYYIQENQTTNPLHPQGWPRINTAEGIYKFKPVPDTLSQKEKSHILGIQTSLWSNFMIRPETWDMAVFPRNCALSEAAWTPLEKKNWEDYQQRLDTHLERLAYRGVAYWRENAEAITEFSLDENDEKVLTFDVTSKIKNAGNYFVTIDYIEGDEKGIQLEEVVLSRNQAPIASDKHLGFTTAKKNHDRIYFLDIQAKKDKGTYTVLVKLKNLGDTLVKGKIFITAP